MNFLDILIIIFILGVTVSGYSRGFILELASLVALAAGIWAALLFSPLAEDLLKSSFNLPEKYLPAIGFLVTFVVVSLAITLIGWLVSKIVDLTPLGFLNKLFGALLGVAKGILLASLILFIISTFDTEEKLVKAKVKENSALYAPVTKVIRLMLPDRWMEKESSKFLVLFKHRLHPR
jgi:membrane protein required for colicin V production